MDTNKKTKTRVSDVIPKSEVNKWKAGDIITISAGCGAGKSYFIKNILYKKAKADGKKILMLIHRSNCVNQFEIEIKQSDKTDVIDIRTYQSVEYAIINSGKFSFDDYGYVVSDEFHYFVEDSGFNHYTDISFNAIVGYKKAVKIFMSATADEMILMINKFVGQKCKRYHYPIEADFSHIKSLTFFNDKDSIFTIADYFKKINRKAIFFLQGVQDAYNLYKRFQDCSMFLCGKSSDNGHKYYKYVDKDKVQKMLTEQKFDDLFLITTSCFDAGANIVDENLHEIIVDMKNTSSLIQCIGRKRSQNPKDKINLHIRMINNKQIGGMRSKRVEGLKRASYLQEYGTKAYVEKYFREVDKLSQYYKALIYDAPTVRKSKNTCTKCVNKMIFSKYEMDVDEYDKMASVGYANYIGNRLMFGGRYNRYYDFYIEGGLTDYLERLVNDKVIMLNAEEKAQLIEKMNVKHNGKLLKSQNSLNAAMVEKKYPYRIEQFETSRMIDGEKRKFKSAWRVIKVEDEKPAKGQIGS